MELKDTTKLMISKDYKDRFKAEYLQLKIRYNKLLSMLEKWDSGELTFTPTCPREIYNKQTNAMYDYLDVLEERAKLEGIDLSSANAEVNYKEDVDAILETYKNQKIDWWSWDDFKSYLKHKIIQKYGKDLDLRSLEGREILYYARNKWENEEW